MPQNLRSISIPKETSRDDSAAVQDIKTSSPSFPSRSGGGAKLHCPGQRRTPLGGEAAELADYRYRPSRSAPRMSQCQEASIASTWLPLGGPSMPSQPELASMRGRRGSDGRDREPRKTRHTSHLLAERRDGEVCGLSALDWALEE
ncbi:hypothetical protein DL765_007548 [Monosporascus sp. GIB2]|nr:hypothetical protein DL765_007548 [Monosporascus sp. GIB2]